MSWAPPRSPGGAAATRAAPPRDFRPAQDLQPSKQDQQLPHASDVAVTIHLTAFGPFDSVGENPTSVVCRALRDFLHSGAAPDGVEPSLLNEFLSAQVTLQGLTTLEVSGQSCRCNVRRIMQGLQRRLRGQPGKQACAIVHLGVSGHSAEMRLECQALNLADFCIPDVSGWQPRGEPVVPQGEPSLSTTLCLPDIAGELHDRGVTCAISTDAGSYICNYIFYVSLHAARATRIPVLFVHLPSLEVLSQGKQVTAVLCLLLAVARQMRSEQAPRRPPERSLTV